MEARLPSKHVAEWVRLMRGWAPGQRQLLWRQSPNAVYRQPAPDAHAAGGGGHGHNMHATAPALKQQTAAASARPAAADTALVPLQMAPVAALLVGALLLGWRRSRTAAPAAAEGSRGAAAHEEAGEGNAAATPSRLEML